MFMETEVRAGMDRLSAIEPGWKERIDSDELDVASELDCPLGQLFGSFAYGVQRVLEGNLEEAKELGFMVVWSDEMPDYPYHQLTTTWLALMKEGDGNGS